jgi:anti-anti-sigma regulatory factor
MSPREWSSTGSTTASSSPTPATSRGACERRFAGPDEPHWLVFDAEAVSHVEATGVEAQREFAVRLPRDGVGPVVARMKPSVHEVLVASGVAEAMGEERFLPTIRAAVAARLARDAAPVAGPA